MVQTDLIFNAAIIAIIAGLIFKSIVIVKEQTSAVIERLGKFNKICDSGLHFIIPFIDRKVDIVNLRVQQLDVGVETKTMDDVFVNLKVSVQFKVTREKVRDAYYSLDNARGQIASYVFDDVRAEVPKLELDDVFAKKDDIAKAVRINIAEIMEEFGYTIIKTLITDIDPDHKVKESMNRINAAKRDKEAAMEVAAGRKITIIAEAEAEAESKRLSGEGIARQRLEIVRGFKESVEDFQKTLKNVSHEEVMQFVLLTQYFDTINNVGSNSKNTSILIPHSPGAMQDFQNQIIQGTFIGEKLNEFTDDDDDQKDND
ncbi:SPFH domain-containing protein [Lishizhenia sp.]|uniref:SPFH domain-containing protein n=1 Tax=Lishizhenia sp. TaxID=2497594 RepID=UPI00299E7435|nr:SPFH domain-containing protein [Lishizhenia sp.]MDX1446000.1 SPFH domain-containing protein [Lishizhenia sp.]